MVWLRESLMATMIDQFDCFRCFLVWVFFSFDRILIEPMLFHSHIHIDLIALINLNWKLQTSIIFGCRSPLNFIKSFSTHFTYGGEKRSNKVNILCFSSFISIILVPIKPKTIINQQTNSKSSSEC